MSSPAGPPPLLGGALTRLASGGLGDVRMKSALKLPSALISRKRPPAKNSVPRPTPSPAPEDRRPTPHARGVCGGASATTSPPAHDQGGGRRPGAGEARRAGCRGRGGRGWGGQPRNRCMEDLAPKRQKQQNRYRSPTDNPPDAI